MARKGGFLLNLIIFILVFMAGFLFFPPEQGGGPFSSMLFLGDSLLDLNLVSEAGGATGMIINFIISVGIYYLASIIITFTLLLIFGKKD